MAFDVEDFQTDLAGALARLADDLERWQQSLFKGDDWYEQARMRLMQIRSEFRGGVDPAFDAAQRGDAAPFLIGLLAQVNGITFVSALTRASSEGDDFDDDVVAGPVECAVATPCLDLFMQKFDRLHQNAADAMNDQSDWDSICNAVLEAAGEVVGVVKRIRNGLTQSGGSEMISGGAALPHGKKKRTDPHKVMIEMEKYLQRHPFPGINELMRKYECGKSTVYKAIERSDQIKSSMARCWLLQLPGYQDIPLMRLPRGFLVDQLISLLSRTTRSKPKLERYASVAFRKELMDGDAKRFASLLKELPVGPEQQVLQRLIEDELDCDRSRPAGETESA